MNPSPGEIIEARKDAELTQKQAANVIGVSSRTWQYWENGRVKMKQSFYDLFLIRVFGSDKR